MDTAWTGTAYHGLTEELEEILRLMLAGRTAVVPCVHWKDRARVREKGGRGCPVRYVEAGLRCAGWAADAREVRVPDWDRLGPNERQKVWADLVDHDSVVAGTAYWTLVGGGEGVAAFLRERLRPAARLDTATLTGTVRRLIADLDADHYAARESASQALLGIGPAAAPELRQALAGRPPAEVRLRAIALLSTFESPMVLPGGELFRTMKAIAVLERVGNREAREVLTVLAGGEPTARETKRAKAALGGPAGN